MHCPSVTTCSLSFFFVFQCSFFIVSLSHGKHRISSRTFVNRKKEVQQLKTYVDRIVKLRGRERAVTVIVSDAHE